MNEIKAIIVDDEVAGRLTMRNILEEHCPEVTILAECKGVEDGKKEISALKPDLVFLDIQLRPGTGFDILQGLDKLDFQVIFCTAFDEYALKAFDFAALHYLMKPINALEVIEAVGRFGRGKEFSPQQMELLQTNLNQEQFGKIAIPSKDGLEFLNLEEIIHCQAEGSYTWFFLTQGRKFIASKRLGHYAKMMENTFFQRVHHSHLINLKFLSRYYKGRGGRVEMEDGSEIPVSERMKKALLQRLKVMHSEDKD